MISPPASQTWFLGLVLSLLGAAVLPTPTSAQPVDGVEAPPEFQRDVDDEQGPSGTTDESDAADAQAQEAERDGGQVKALGRKATAQVEEIVVTARKREEALEDTPVAVTALGGAALRESNVVRIDQLRELVPNLQFQATVQGNLAQFKIRGIGSGSADIQFDPGVAIYLDGVFLPRASGSLLNVVDVQQIEVLRGPQGTLFGKNSVGGAINVTTVKPQPDLEAFTMIRPGNLNALDTEVMINVPVIEDLLLSRVSFFTSQRDGYVHNTFRDDYYSDANDMAFQGSLRFLPTKDLTFDVSGLWSRSHTKGLGGQCIVARENAPLSSLYNRLYPPCRETTLFSMSANIDGLSDIESAGTWGVLNYDIGDAGVFENLAIKALGSWNHQTPRQRFDVDNTLEDIVYLSTAGGSPLDGEPGKAQQTSGEIQLNGGALDGTLVFVGGLFAQWEKATDTKATNVAPPLSQFNTNRATIDNWTWAPYMQVTADVTDWVSLTGGIRYTQDHKQLTLTQFESLTGEVFFPTTTDSKLFEKWTPMATIASTLPLDLLPDWSEHFMGYFTYSQGFKGGGFNALPGPRPEEGLTQLAAPFEPETVDNYEIGFKTILFKNRLTLNTAFFYANYDDIQKISVVTTGTGEETITERITENAAKATVKGFEIEALAYPIDGLQVTGNIGVTDAKYDSFPNGISDFDDETVDRAGESFNNVPEFASFLAIQYSWPLKGHAEILKGWITPRFEWYYQSKVHLNGPELPQSDQSGYNLLNARLSYDFWDDRAQVALWARNLADQEYIVFSTPTVSTFGFLVNFPGAPRTWGAELSYRF